VEESEGELHGQNLKAFQERVRTRGALSAYRVGEGSYLVVDRGAAPVLETMATMQHAAAEEREDFVRNPRPLITAAIERALRSAGKLEGLTPAGEEEAIEAVAGPALVETREYSERVTGLTIYEKQNLDVLQPSGTTWLPEHFASIAPALGEMKTLELGELCEKVKSAISSGEETVEIAGQQLPATPETLHALEGRYEARRQEEARQEKQPKESGETESISTAPIIIDTKDNFDELQWRPARGPRLPRIARSIPPGIETPLKQHQSESLDWQIDAWTAGLPGILNADEQGLGKTLQTIAFLRWLQGHMASPEAEERGPVLVVAPTSLLENWEAEVQRHLDEAGLGHLIRLYGSGLGGYRRSGTKGVDTESGEERLNFELLHEAISEGRGHRFWILTTYTTLTNYQHSLENSPSRPSSSTRFRR
jgi:hypothetical protein